MKVTGIATCAGSGSVPLPKACTQCHATGTPANLTFIRASDSDTMEAYCRDYRCHDRLIVQSHGLLAHSQVRIIMKMAPPKRWNRHILRSIEMGLCTISKYNIQELFEQYQKTLPKDVLPRANDFMFTSENRPMTDQRPTGNTQRTSSEAGYISDVKSRSLQIDPHTMQSEQRDPKSVETDSDSQGIYSPSKTEIDSNELDTSEIRREQNKQKATYIRQIRSIYRIHNPAKLAGVDKLVEKYDRNVDELYLAICRKYQVEPDLAFRCWAKQKQTAISNLSKKTVSSAVATTDHGPIAPLVKFQITTATEPVVLSTTGTMAAITTERPLKIPKLAIPATIPAECRMSKNKAMASHCNLLGGMQTIREGRTHANWFESIIDPLHSVKDDIYQELVQARSTQFADQCEIKVLQDGTAGILVFHGTAARTASTTLKKDGRSMMLYLDDCAQNTASKDARGSYYTTLAICGVRYPTDATSIAGGLRTPAYLGSDYVGEYLNNVPTPVKLLHVCFLPRSLIRTMSILKTNYRTGNIQLVLPSPIRLVATFILPCNALLISPDKAIKVSSTFQESWPLFCTNRNSGIGQSCFVPEEDRSDTARNARS
jgi:hypothetical protein